MSRKQWTDVKLGHLRSSEIRRLVHQHSCCKGLESRELSVRGGASTRHSIPHLPQGLLPLPLTRRWRGAVADIRLRRLITLQLRCPVASVHGSGHPLKPHQLMGGGVGRKPPFSDKSLSFRGL